MASIRRIFTLQACFLAGGARLCRFGAVISILTQFKPSLPFCFNVFLDNLLPSGPVNCGPGKAEDASALSTDLSTTSQSVDLLRGCTGADGVGSGSSALQVPIHNSGIVCCCH
ncbi:hypothetical protein L228DRAFT_246332 [Xylona heveae TC161]|uniref:Uncharacterized protein n=1 Tax=Xylona heveae (strain CBS 132557 / TC161) TaxID=1328760 RepID=A0A161TCM3_XYLHT|nr:hypothetical protein L228DRAFT_246332 [Xylona heveae TC161]KZF23547.1 hypothetical protein L228DRAFT_246332 [Xylona heveae TC161]